MRPPRLIVALAAAALVAAMGAAGAVAQAPGGHAGLLAVLDPVTRAHGSPSDYVFDLAQDRAGFVWIGTDAGLVRYDGRDFVTWTTADGLPDNYVYAVHEALDGRLWVGTYRGLAVVERGRLRQVDTVGSVQALAHDAQGRVYVGSVGGVRVWERGRLRWLLRGEASAEPSFVERPGGRLAFPMHDGTVAVLSPSARGVAVTRVRAALPAGTVLVALTGHGDALFETPSGGGMVPVAGGRVTLLPGASVRSTLALPGGETLVGTESGALWRLDGRGGAVAAVRPGAVGGYAVGAMLRDYEGRIWLGLFGGGLRRLAEPHLTLPADARLGASILRLSRDRGGTVWMTTRDALLARAAPSGRAPGDAPGGAPVQTVAYARPLGLAETHPAGGHYVSTGISIRHTSSAAAAPRAVIYDGNWISSLLLGPGDTLHVGTYGSRVRRVVGSREAAPASGPDVTEALVPGAAGTLWALTRSQGAHRYASGRWTAVRAGLPSPSVYSLLDEPGGPLWLGTDRGLVRRDGPDRYSAAAAAAPRQRVFDDGGRLRGQRLHAIFRTSPRRNAPTDTLWVVADDGLYVLAADTLRALAHVRLRPDARAAIHAALPLPEARRLLLGTSSGLVEVDLSRLPPPPPLPRVAFLGADGARTGAPAPDTLRLTAGVRTVDLAFAPLTFGGAPGQLQHRIGDGPWSAPTEARTISLVGLTDGWHRLDVRGVAAGGAGEAVRVALYVPPPWWRTVAARLAGLGLLVLLVAAGARWVSTRRLRARLRAVETERRVEAAQVRERDRISRDLHDHVGAQLTGILAGLDLLGDEDGPSARPLVGALRDEVRETMGALRTTLLTLQHPPPSVEALGALLARYARDQMRFRTAPVLRCHVAVDASGSGDGAAPGSTAGAAARPLDPYAALHVFHVAQEAVQNAIRHAAATRVDVGLAVDAAGAVVLSVADDGAFRPPDGAGHGLGSMQARADEIGASLVVDGTPRGTTVRLTWPASRQRTARIVRSDDAPRSPHALP